MSNHGLLGNVHDAGKLGGNLIGSGGERGGSNKDKGVAGS